MKRLFFVLFVIGNALIVSCDNKPDPEKPFPIGSWQTTHEYFSLTVDDANPEEFKEMRERESSDAITVDESYRLEFREDGTGSGSGVHPDGPGRWNFSFTWQLSEDRLTISGNGAVFYDIRVLWEKIDWNEIDTVDDVVFEEDVRAENQVIWKVEESSAGEMVLSTFWYVRMVVSGWWYHLNETHTYRYTFKKVD